MTAHELQQAFKYIWPGEVDALKTLAQSLPANPVVINIGAGAGTSGLAFLEARPDLRLVTVDVQYDDSPFGCIVAEEREVNRAGYSSRYDYRVGDSKFIGRGWLYIVDLVFIDGDHSYEGAKGDIMAWLPNVKTGGILALHDYHKDELYRDATDYKPDAPHPQDWPGVTQAVDELLLGKFEIVMRVDSLIAFRVGK